MFKISKIRTFKLKFNSILKYLDKKIDLMKSSPDHSMSNVSVYMESKNQNSPVIMMPRVERTLFLRLFHSLFLLNVRFPIRYADYVKIKQTSCLFSRSSQPKRRVTWKQIIAVWYDECYHECVY